LSIVASERFVMAMPPLASTVAIVPISPVVYCSASASAKSSHWTLSHVRCGLDVGGVDPIVLRVSALHLLVELSTQLALLVAQSAIGEWVASEMTFLNVHFS